MKPYIINFFVLFIIASLLATNVYAESQVDTPNPYENFSQIVTVDTTDWLTSANGAFDVILSNVQPATILANGVYPGWCIEREITGDLHNQSAIVYSSLNINLPSDLAQLPWGKINYLLNHKIHEVGKSDHAFFQDVQLALWMIVEGQDQPIPGVTSAAASQMAKNANSHPGYVPVYGDIVAFIVYSDGLTKDETDHIQETIIEVKLLAPPTSTPTVTATNTVTNTPTFTSTGTLPTNTPTFTPTSTFTFTPTGTLPTNTPTFTPTNTPTSTPTNTSTPIICQPTVIVADVSKFTEGTSIEGMGKVIPNLNIDAKGTAIKIATSIKPNIYFAPNGGGLSNGELAAGGGFSDLVSKDAQQAHRYTFTFASGTSVSNFSLHMLDFGDLNPMLSTSHLVSMVAYNAANEVVSIQELKYTSSAEQNPHSSDLYGDLFVSGDAASGLPGQPGNWTWSVSGSGIVKVILEFGVGFDPNIGFDKLMITNPCP